MAVEQRDGHRRQTTRRGSSGQGAWRKSTAITSTWTASGNSPPRSASAGEGAAVGEGPAAAGRAGLGRNGGEERPEAITQAPDSTGQGLATPRASFRVSGLGMPAHTVKPPFPPAEVTTACGILGGLLACTALALCRPVVKARRGDP